MRNGDYTGQQNYTWKSNKISAVQELPKELDISGCMVVADALNGQEKTAKAVVDGKGDYLLRVKGNHAGLEADIEDYVQDDSLRKSIGYKRPERKEPGQNRNADGICYGRYCMASRQGEMPRAVLAQFIRNLRKRAEKPANSIIISPAGN